TATYRRVRAVRQRDRQREAAVVVGELADEVDAPRGGPHAVGLLAEGRHEGGRGARGTLLVRPRLLDGGGRGRGAVVGHGLLLTRRGRTAVGCHSPGCRGRCAPAPTGRVGAGASAAGAETGQTRGMHLVVTSQDSAR